MPIKLPERVDVAIVGAGTAGAACAVLCARRGLRVLCLDRAPLDEAGARWINGVPAWAFDEAALARPRGEELHGADVPFNLTVGWGPTAVRLEGHGVLEVDMRLLVARLQAEAAERGAVLAGGVRVEGLDGHVLRTDAGPVKASWLVDASGLTGARLLDQPACPPTDLCAAAQEVRKVLDPAAARAFFERRGVAFGETISFAGVAGGYSVVNVRADEAHVSLLTGSIPADGHPSGRALLDRFVAEQPWIGPPVFGGARAIPLRAPLHRLARGPVALLGDAGSQVFPAHGSGIGVGLVAARLLADALAEGQGPAGYQVAWQRRYGALCAAYDLFRRFSQTLTLPELERLVARRILDPRLLVFGLAQRFPELGPALVAEKTWLLLAEPELLRRLGEVIAKMVALRAVYPRYPRDDARLGRWAAWVDRLSA